MSTLRNKGEPGSEFEIKYKSVDGTSGHHVDALAAKVVINNHRCGCGTHGITGGIEADGGGRCSVGVTYFRINGPLDGFDCDTVSNRRFNYADPVFDLDLQEPREY